MDLRSFLKETNGRCFYVMDTETTGFKADKFDAIEVSALKVLNNHGKFEIKGEFDSFINPHYPLPQAIVDFNQREGTGICDALLRSQPDADEVAERLNEFFGKDADDLYVVGHNIDKFDVPFIRKLLDAGCYDFYPETFDTLTYAKAHYSDINPATEKVSHALGIVFEHTDKIFSKAALEAGTLKAHLSIGDCYMTLDVMDREIKTEKSLQKNSLDR